nr:hypothetical protein Itr_chr09CG18160 [Ipomoea trifida]
MKLMVLGWTLVLGLEVQIVQSCKFGMSFKILLRACGNTKCLMQLTHLLKEHSHSQVVMLLLTHVIVREMLFGCFVVHYLRLTLFYGLLPLLKIRGLGSGLNPQWS